ncbi:hypothetical protein [Rhodanobacter glycinis]|uniref:Serine/threonine protein kinase n=1 Tax=Rhodanobacter glycinis TaxID=582702 RepID=A0A1I4EEF5_9GAMM|nr:hypothetical protein [Rhodanobacter glycinis]SFL04164.1 hypothetical protein SAMN05192579_11254 [Rhodanobacter glycinis]
MELDEMKLAWQTMGQQLERQNALQLELLRQGRADRLHRHLRPLAWGQSLLIVLGVAIMLWGISFWSTHLGIWQAVACGAFMQLFGTLAFAFPIRLLVMQQGIDYTAPVLDIQRRLARMRVWRVKVEAPVFAVLGGVVWIPALLMLAQYEADPFGLNPWQHLRPSLMPWLLSSVAVAIGLVFLARFAVRRLGHGRWLENGLAGSAIVRAEAALEEMARFERD